MARNSSGNPSRRLRLSQVGQFPQRRRTTGLSAPPTMPRRDPQSFSSTFFHLVVAPVLGVADKIACSRTVNPRQKDETIGIGIVEGIITGLRLDPRQQLAEMRGRNGDIRIQERFQHLMDGCVLGAKDVFSQKHGFRATDFTDGDNEEREPDVYYTWEPPR